MDFDIGMAMCGDTHSNGACSRIGHLLHNLVCFGDITIPIFKHRQWCVCMFKRPKRNFTSNRVQVIKIEFLPATKDLMFDIKHEGTVEK